MMGNSKPLPQLPQISSKFLAKQKYVSRTLTTVKHSVTMLCPGHTVAMFSGEYARSCNSSLLVAYSWSIFTVQHSPWIVIWLRQFQTVQNYRHASSISLQFFTDGGGFVDFVAPSYPNSPLRSRLLHCSSLFANFPLKIVG